jgi:cytochrome c peroxidase
VRSADRTLPDAAATSARPVVRSATRIRALTPGDGSGTPVADVTVTVTLAPARDGVIDKAMTQLSRILLRAVFLAPLALVVGCASETPESPHDPELMARLEEHAWPDDAAPPPDATNQWADDERAAALGHKLFFDPRFSGPLLDEVNDGTPGTLGQQGETGRVACVSCHVAQNGAFLDTRSPRQQLSVASSWTFRKAPSLLDVAQAKFVRWDGRRDTLHANIFSVIESPIEFNSSRLFVAQQIASLYQSDYEALFGPLPDLGAYAPLAAAEAGCSSLPSGEQRYTATCPKEGDDDEAVIRVVANAGKAIAAYLRQLSCGSSRFDAWIRGDESALTPEEKNGALLFVGKGECQTCHTGPYFTDQKFHNIGVEGELVPFTGVDNADDPGAASAFAALRDDPLNSRGPFSDGDDGRLDALPGDLDRVLGAFRTPSLRCVSRHPAHMHNGVFRSLFDVLRFFERGGDESGFVGVSENRPRGLNEEEREHLVLFLEALDGDGPRPELRQPPALP